MLKMALLFTFSLSLALIFPLVSPQSVSSPPFLWRRSIHAVRRDTFEQAVIMNMDGFCAGWSRPWSKECGDEQVYRAISQMVSKYPEYCELQHKTIFLDRLREKCQFDGTLGQPNLVDVVLMKASQIFSLAFPTANKTHVPDKIAFSFAQMYAMFEPHWSSLLEDLDSGRIGPAFSRLYQVVTSCINVGDCPQRFWTSRKPCRFTTTDGTEEGDIEQLHLTIEMPLLDSDIELFQVDSQIVSFLDVSPEETLCLPNPDGVEFLAYSKARNCTHYMAANVATSRPTALYYLPVHQSLPCLELLPLSACRKALFLE